MALLMVQISHNRSIDGVLDLLDSKKMTEAGPVDLIDDDADDVDDLLPPPPEGINFTLWSLTGYNKVYLSLSIIALCVGACSCNSQKSQN